MTGLVSVYTTFPDVAEAERVGRALVDERLAACINISGPCRSIYRWQGAIEQADEVAALLKTTADLGPRLIERLGELHSYEVPGAVICADRADPCRLWRLDPGRDRSAATPEVIQYHSPERGKS
jgi:periplasmic divalent cation tolerance protein